MKNLGIKAFYFSILISIMGCGLGAWNVTELYYQKIEGTSKLLYKYEAWGGRDSRMAGYLILDSNESFEVDPLKNLPFSYLQGISSNSVISGVSHICLNSCGEKYKDAIPIYIPIKKEESEKEGFKVINFIFQYKGFAQTSGLSEFYQFENFKEMKDSLFFYNLDDVEGVNGKHLDALKLKKTDIYLQQRKDHTINKIIVEEMILENSTNQIVSHRRFHLTPKQNIYSDAFSNYGIFKEVSK